MRRAVMSRIDMCLGTDEDREAPRAALSDDERRPIVRTS